jgi:hypothetical protein
MMSSGTTMLPLSSARHATIVPHRAAPSTRPARPGDQPVRCPRCGDLVALPASASDGDLTECRGLLLRVTCDEHGCLLERL